MDAAGLGNPTENTAPLPLFRPPSNPPLTDVRSAAKPCLRCVVCGDTSSGKHYGVLACNGCSGFFKRSVRRKLIYRCQAASGDCIVDKAHRNQCQACRLKKCLECGMNRDAVQNERQPRNSSTVGSEFSFINSASKSCIKTPPTLDQAAADITVGVFSPFFTLPSRMMPPNPFGLTKFHHQHHGLKEEVLTAGAPPDDDLRSRSFRDAPGAKCERAFDPDGKESVHEISSRILLMTIRWARNFPSFSGLCLDDQIVLLEEAWSELFLLSALQWGLPLDANPLLSALETTPSKMSREVQKYLYTLQKASSRLKMLGTDLAEFACLKAIILFNPDTGRIKDAYQVEMLQDHAQLMLAHHMKSQHIDYTFRFGHLLLILPTFRQIPAETVEALFFGNVIASTSMEKMLCEMFKP